MENKSINVMIVPDHDRLSYLFASNPAIIYSCSADLGPGVTFISSNLERILGYTVEEFTSYPMFWIDHVHPEDRIMAKEKYPVLLEMGQWDREYRFLHKNGAYCWMRDEMRVVYDEQGQPLELVGTWQDVTQKRIELIEQKEAQEELFKTKEMYHLLVNSIPKMAVFLLDANLRFLFAEGQDLLANGFHSQDFVGKTLLELFPDQKHPLYQPYLDVLQGVSQVLEYPSPNGKIFQIHISPVRDEEGNIVSALAISRDITDDKKMEQLLLRVAIDGNESNRKVVSEQLHDGVGQKLSSLKFELESLNSYDLPPGDPQKRIIEKSKNTLNEVLHQLRGLANNLMPNVLLDFGLDSALEDLCMETNKSGNVRVNYGSYGTFLSTNNYNIDLGIYRIVQELINNGLRRHMQIEILVRLIRSPQSIFLTVEKHYLESGVPQYFDRSEEFYNITSRAKALNGHLKVELLDKERLLITVEVPLS